jgi:hypothetical protein
MATAKKTTKKATPAKKAPLKKVTPKAAVKKKTTAKKSTAKAAELRSFRIAREQRAFTDFQITRQTVYWIILVAFIIFAQLWILKLQVEVATLLDTQQAQLQNF